MQHISTAHNWIPFTLSEGQEQPKMNIQRIIETLLMAIITGAVTALILVYVASQVLGERIQNMQNDITRIEKSVNKINNDFYPPVTRGRYNQDNRYGSD